MFSNFKLAVERANGTALRGMLWNERLLEPLELEPGQSQVGIAYWTS